MRHQNKPWSRLCTCEDEVWTADTPRGEDGLDHHPNCRQDKPWPGAGMLTRNGVEPDPRVSTWLDWVRVARDQHKHFMGIDVTDPAKEVAFRHHALTTADLVPYLVAQLEYSWEQIETWVKWWRDQQRLHHGNDSVSAQAIDDLLDDLRDHLACGVPLHKACGPHTETNEEDRWTP